MPAWVPTETLQLNDIGRVRLGAGLAAADRLLPRAPRHRCLHPRRRGRRLDPRRRHGRIDPVADHRARSRRSADPITRYNPKEGHHDRSLPRPARPRQPRPAGIAGQPPDPRRAARHPARARRARSPSSTTARPAGCRWSTSWSARARPRSCSFRCCCPTPSTPQAEVPALLAQVRAAHPELRVTASRPIGPEAQLLSIIDRRLRDALRARRVCELDGLVFSAAGSTDVRSNALVARRARQWSTHHRLPCVTAFATGSGPSTAEAVRTLRAQGRRHIAVGSWFLSRGCSTPTRPSWRTRPARWPSRRRWAASRRSPRSP